jgi:hypothetical protein
LRHLIVCCDGTWQDVAQHSNVSRLHTAIVTPPGHPEPLYVRGVGVSWNPVDVLRGGLTGAGLSDGIKEGYHWLVREFRQGDRIAVFGFSRGAYTARSLAGMIGRVGLVDGSGLGSRELGEAVARAYKRYRDSRTIPEDPSWHAGLDLAYEPGDPDIPVDFVGVWDTVGALGIPTYVGIPDVLGSRKRYEFLDVVLNRHIKHARQAVSIDEMRGPFRPTLWRGMPAEQDVRQVWFPGDHGDVGGGHWRKGLSDGALDWMMRETTAAIGLEFDRGRIRDFAPDPTGTLHRMPGGPLGAALEVATEPRPRAVPRIDLQQRDDDVDVSAYHRQQATGYRTTQTLARPGATAQVTVPAGQAWTESGLYLEPGTYRFEATGEWRSFAERTGPDGDTSGRHAAGAFQRAVFGAAQSALRALLRNAGAHLVGVRRDPDRPWMSLLGLVANEQTDAAGNTLCADELLVIGAGTTAEVHRPGYFYAFPNDAWGFYGNNSGAVQLSITRS